jgi:diguanylate cyclase (GGDEF)-like protein
VVTSISEKDNVVKELAADADDYLTKPFDPAGDQVLQKFGEMLRENARASDLSGRMGGDEFLLVMTHLDEKSTRLTVERLRAQFAALKFSFGGNVVSVMASFGIAGFQGKEPPEFCQLVKQADKAPYSGKRAGRNQVTAES